MMLRLSEPMAGLVTVLCLMGCGRTDAPAPQEGGFAVEMTLSSSAFSFGEPIPAKFTGDGADVSPPLTWGGAPEETEVFALVCDDPDAPMGTWVHWVLYDIPAAVTSLPENVGPEAAVPGMGINGVNDFGRLGYGGPAPPRGKRHRYYFTLYALDTPTGLPSGRSKKDIEKAIKGHVIAGARLMGTYQR